MYEKKIKTLRRSDEISVEEEDPDQRCVAWFRNFACLISEYKIYLKEKLETYRDLLKIVLQYDTAHLPPRRRELEGTSI